ncbi:hypothetical protein [Burkholderia pseudomallei]|uniref:hypothetical protein n=1 Tax=Burkholderia pseudomallei TaxID=28450 RepID=UPI0012AD58D6|nr:hypothetical protein [Burkholderia pseudomallei]MBM5617638.1 hypothetical protein [Burkholderia pseudomallei]MBM5628896.1 hypothetical protein [Burkholderia pseudomallei]MBM5657241.1 hypothetical protein [Burkholderia pseudomallei]
MVPSVFISGIRIAATSQANRIVGQMRETINRRDNSTQIPRRMQFARRARIGRAGVCMRAAHGRRDARRQRHPRSMYADTSRSRTRTRKTPKARDAHAVCAAAPCPARRSLIVYAARSCSPLSRMQERTRNIAQGIPPRARSFTR